VLNVSYLLAIAMYLMPGPQTHDLAALGLRANGFDLPPDVGAIAFRLPDSFVASARGTTLPARLEAACFLRESGEASLVSYICLHHAAGQTLRVQSYFMQHLCIGHGRMQPTCTWCTHLPKRFAAGAFVLLGCSSAASTSMTSCSSARGGLVGLVPGSSAN